jgi:hypothetical protein
MYIATFAATSSEHEFMAWPIMALYAYSADKAVIFRSGPVADRGLQAI